MTLSPAMFVTTAANGDIKCGFVTFTTLVLVIISPAKAKLVIMELAADFNFQFILKIFERTVHGTAYASYWQALHLGVRS